MLIREEHGSDLEEVRSVNEAAFENAVEANLVDVLRKVADPVISLVAEADGVIVGHIMFSPVTLDGHPNPKLMGLGPMAVAPGEQRKGIGSALVREGLRRCRALGVDAVVVLGHPEYYPRFGFVPSKRFGIGCRYDVPEDVFMVTELRPGSLAGKAGTVEYHPAFDNV